MQLWSSFSHLYKSLHLYQPLTKGNAFRLICGFAFSLIKATLLMFFMLQHVSCVYSFAVIILNWIFSLVRFSVLHKALTTYQNFFEKIPCEWTILRLYYYAPCIYRKFSFYTYVENVKCISLVFPAQHLPGGKLISDRHLRFLENDQSLHGLLQCVHGSVSVRTLDCWDMGLFLHFHIKISEVNWEKESLIRKKIN